MRTSVYTSLFNYDPEKFDLFGAFKNWSKYSDEIVIATFEDQREGLEELLLKSFWITMEKMIFIIDSRLFLASILH
jgi:hypothetical protein